MDSRAQRVVFEYHHTLLGNKGRMQQYRRAILEVVKPGDVVVDLGTGTGILAFFACEAGARRVYAIEIGPVVELAKEVSRKNGLSDRIVFLGASSFEVNLPERADVLISRFSGNSAVQWEVLRALIDARDRFLKPGGKIIPESIDLNVAPVDLPGIHHDLIDFWSPGLHGVDFSVLRRLAANNSYIVEGIDPDCSLSDPALLCQISTGTAQTFDIQGEAAFVVRRSGTFHGIAGRFNTQLCDGVSHFSSSMMTSPGSKYAFFPVEKPVSFDRGDHVRIAIRSAGEGTVWRWRMVVDGEPGREGAATPRKIDLDQSTFWGFPLAPEKLSKVASGRAPVLSRRGKAELLLLNSFNGQETVSQLENKLSKEYHDCFSSQMEISAFVRDTVARFS